MLRIPFGFSEIDLTEQELKDLQIKVLTILPDLSIHDLRLIDAIINHVIEKEFPHASARDSG